MARTDSLGMGFLAGEKGCLIAPKVPNRKQIFTLGPVLKGQLWETTAVRELRQQAADLARHLAMASTLQQGKTLPPAHWNQLSESNLCARS